MRTAVSQVGKNLAKVRPCIQRAHWRGELAAGSHRLLLSWTIEPDGSISDAEVVGPEPITDTPFARCFEKRMAGWRFPPARRATEIARYPFGPFEIQSE